MATALTADEINISHNESLESVLQFLKKHFPESLSLWQLLNNVQRNLLTKQDIWPHQLFVDDRDQIKCLLLIYLTIGFTGDSHLFTEDKKRKQRYVTFFCESKNNHLLIPLLEQYVPWSTIENIIFCANPHHWSPIIESFIRDHELGETNFSSFYQMELEKETFEKNKKLITRSCPSDLVIRPLSVSDADTINDLWAYKSEFSLSRIVFLIEHFPTVGAYSDETLISWYLMQYDGSFGMAFTKPEARRRGISSLLNIYLASKAFELQDRIFSFVSPANVASLTRLEKLGYHQTCDIDWLYFISKSARILQD